MSSTMDYLETTTAATAPTASGELYAEFISAPASSMSPAAIAEHLQQNRITFEIPSAHDLRHIDALHSFNTLLQRGGSSGGGSPASNGISTEQLSNSVVLDLADLREHNADVVADVNTFWEQIFGDADMHAIVNYLWIGVVTSLVVLSLVFILFSCYFYRKFRTWKKCNKDIRAQIHGANDSYSSHGASHHLINSSSISNSSCDASRLLQQQHPVVVGSATNGGSVEAGFYQIESPPCYTIATGLPSYDEALHHQPRHFACGMKFIYPSLAAVHHHHHHHQRQLQLQHHNQHWEKDALQRSSNKLQKCKLSAADEQREEQRLGQTEDKASPGICINMPHEEQEQEQEHEQQQQKDEEHRNAMQTLLPAAAADDDCASLVVVVAA